MRLTVCFLCLLLLSEGKLLSQGNSLDTLYHLNNYAGQVSFGCLPLNDTSYVITSHANTMQNHYEINLFAINLHGDTLWNKRYDYDSVGEILTYKTIYDRNKNILISGPFFNYSVQGYQGMLFKADSLGNVIWMKTYPIAHYGYYQGLWSYDPVATFDNKYLIVCALGVDTNNADFLIIKTDSNGNEEARWQYPTLGYERPRAGIQTSDSGFVFVGLTSNADSLQHYYFSVYVIKTDSNGIMQWNKTYSPPLDSVGRFTSDAVADDVIEEPDGFVVAGHRYARKNYVFPYNPDFFQKAWVAKLSKLNGSIIWERNIGVDTAQYQRFYKVIKTKDGGYALCGAFDLGDQEKFYSCMVKTDAQGDSLWARSFTFAGNDSFFTVLYNIYETIDNSYLLTGYAEPNFGNPFPWVLKVDSMGCLIPGCDTMTATGIKESPEETIGVKVYPNPASNIVYIMMKTNNEVGEFSFKVFDVNGRVLLEQRNAQTDLTYLLNVANYAKGLYFIEVMNREKVAARRKFVKE